MRSRTYKTIAVLVLLFIVVLTGMAIFWRDRKPEYLYSDSLRNDFPKNLIVAHRKGMVKLCYAPICGQYQKQAEVLNIAPRQIVFMGDYILGYQGTTLYRWDKNLTSSIRRDLGQITAIAANSQNAFVAVGQNFIILNQDLEEVSRLLLFSRAYKAVDSIVICQNTAYLLDDIRIPIYLFRIDITHPASPKIIGIIELSMKYGHAYEQWLIPQLNQWLISYISNYDFGYRRGQSIHVTFMKMDKEKASDTSPEARTRLNELLGKDGTGIHFIRLTDWNDLKNEYNRFADGKPYFILGITPLPPTWAIVRSYPESIHQPEIKYQLVKISSVQEKIAFVYTLALPDFTDLRRVGGISRAMLIKYQSDYLFISPGAKVKVPSWGYLFFREPAWRQETLEEYAFEGIDNMDILQILDVKDRPTVLFTSNLKRYGIQGITDLLPY